MEIYGKKYVNGTIIVTKITDDGPVFGKITKIYEVSGEIHFLINEIKVNYFKFHYHAYKVNIQHSTVL